MAWFIPLKRLSRKPNNKEADKSKPHRQLLVTLTMAVALTVILTFAPATPTPTYIEQGPKQQEQLIKGEPPSRGKLRNQQGRIMVVESTAYTHTGYRTFTETWPQEGRTIAVDDKVIKIGSRVHIEGLGWRVAEDKIPAESVARGAVIDIFLSREGDCWAWGRRDVRVVVESVDKNSNK